MNNFLKLALLLYLIPSCAYLNDSKPQLDSLSNGSKIDIKNFLNGDLEGFAITQNAQGKIENTFTAKINGSWEGNKGTVRYNFYSNNVKLDNRTWLITINDDKTYSAIGHDAIEPAQGQQIGNLSYMSYKLLIPYQDKKQKISFEDRTYLVDEKSAIIISTMKSGNTVLTKSIISVRKTGNYTTKTVESKALEKAE
jgi:hypothetical protein